MQEETIKHRLGIAAEELYNDYLNDSELIVFSNLDQDDFYEAKIKYDL